MTRHLRSSIAACMLLVGAPLMLSGCGDTVVRGNIPPSTFQFINVVASKKMEPSGWKVAQVIILLGKISPRYAEAAKCQVEVGVPEAIVGRIIPTEVAQRAAASAADEAARRVLKKKRLPTALACDEFKKTMQSFMNDPEKGNIPGTRVTSFLTPGISPTTFP